MYLIQSQILSSMTLVQFSPSELGPLLLCVNVPDAIGPQPQGHE